MVVEKISEQELFVRSLKDYRKQWEHKLKITDSEKISKNITSALMRWASPLFTGKKEINFESWIPHFEEYLRQDIERRKTAKGLERERIDCWIGMHTTTIEMSRIFITFQKAKNEVEEAKEKFRESESFENAKQLYLTLSKEIEALNTLGKNFAKKVEFQDKLISLTKQKFSDSPINWSEAVLADIIAIHIGESKVPIATSVKIIHKFGISAYDQFKSITLQSKRLDSMSKKFLLWDKILSKEMKALGAMLPKD